MAEKTFLNSNGIVITNSRFVVNSQTYAMSSVNSVKVTKEKISKSNAIPGWMFGIGGLWLVISIATEPLNISGHIIPALIFAAGITWIWRSEDKFEYGLVLSTSSGETTALSSEHPEGIKAVEKALTDAIVYRG